jgi:Cft2 family RNA processing exonuclease
MYATPPKPRDWLKTTTGLYCEPGDFHIDPTGPVDRAVITHGHGDHARANNRHVLATEGTLAIMRARFGEEAGGHLQSAAYDERIRYGPVREVEPGLVLEIAFDSVHRSTRHKSGLAMRFPRVHRIRWDKPYQEADTVAALEKLVT